MVGASCQFQVFVSFFTHSDEKKPKRTLEPRGSLFWVYRDPSNVVSNIEHIFTPKIGEDFHQF